MKMRQNYLIMIGLVLLTWTSHAQSRRLVFLGDSLTSGYTLDADLAYPALIQRKIDDAGLGYKVINSGISGDTTAGGLRRIDWLLRQRVDVMVIALGANDGLRGLPAKEAEQNLSAMIDKVREKSPTTKILFAGMLLPENMGGPYKSQFESIYPRIAAKYDVPLMPFLLEGVAADPALNLPDGLHPNEQGQQIIAGNMWEFISPHLAPPATSRRRSGSF